MYLEASFCSCIMLPSLRCLGSHKITIRPFTATCQCCQCSYMITSPTATQLPELIQDRLSSLLSYTPAWAHTRSPFHPLSHTHLFSLHCHAPAWSRTTMQIPHLVLLLPMPGGPESQGRVQMGSQPFTGAMRFDKMYAWLSQMASMLESFMGGALLLSVLAVPWLPCPFIASVIYLCGVCD